MLKSIPTTSNIQLKNASLAEIAEVASDVLYSGTDEQKSITVKDVSGNSGAKTYICCESEIPKCIVKVTGGESIMSSHQNTIDRVLSATQVMQDQGIAPLVLMKGADFHLEKSAGLSTAKDFFHFDKEIAPPHKIASLLAEIHSAPTGWFTNLREKFLHRDIVLKNILEPVPAYAPCWCLPWSAYDTGLPVLGVGNPDRAIAQRILELEIETGVYEKVMQCTAFFPASDAARRQVVVHNDFKPDNILHDPDTGSLTAIDYDLVQVGAAVMDFGLPYMMWLGSRFTSFEYRRAFVKAYLDASRLPSEEQHLRDFMLDCEVNTIVAFPGLLSNIYDAEIPLLRGVKHPTAKSGFIASGPDAAPTGIEIVDLLAEAVQTVRSDKKLIDICLENGLVVTMFCQNGFGSKPLFTWLKEMQKNRMLRLFGIAEDENSELYVSDHARK